jgi:predicted negative regulator of RcsB-dependent stress response
VAGGVYLAYAQYQSAQEKNAQEEYFAIQKRIETITEANAKAEEELRAKDGDAKKDTKKVEKTAAAKTATAKTPEELKKQYGEVITTAESFIQNHAQRKASVMAALQVAGLATTYSDLELAQKTLATVVSWPDKKELFYGLVRSQLGSVLLDLKQTAEAARYFQEIVDNKAQTYFHPHALLRVAQMELGDFEKAEATFTRVETDHPTTQAANQAKNFKRLLAIKKSQQET